MKEVMLDDTLLDVDAYIKAHPELAAKKLDESKHVLDGGGQSDEGNAQASDPDEQDTAEERQGP